MGFFESIGVSVILLRTRSPDCSCHTAPQHIGSSILARLGQGDGVSILEKPQCHDVRVKLTHDVLRRLRRVSNKRLDKQHTSAVVYD